MKPLKRPALSSRFAAGSHRLPLSINTSHTPVQNCLITFLLALLSTLTAFWFFRHVPENPSNIALVYITGIVLVSRFTDGYLYGIISSLIGVVCVNFLFTYPYFTLNFTLTGYPVTFLFMLLISLIISAMTSQIKSQGYILVEHEKQLMEAEKEKMRANLLRSVSHDLRTPLTGIIGNTSAYIENQTALSEEEKLEIVTHIHDDSNWLLNMVENLLSVTRIDASSMSIATSEESVEEVVAEAIQRLQKRLKNASVQVTVPDEFLLVPMDAMLIEQVIINLLENAVVHSQSNQPVELTVTASESQVIFQVADYGIGIDEARLPALFDGSAYTHEQGTDSHKGMGIGLSICKTIITAHGGTITAHNREKGCVFTFTLPRGGKSHAA